LSTDRISRRHTAIEVDGYGVTIYQQSAITKEQQATISEHQPGDWQDLYDMEPRETAEAERRERE